MHSLSVIPQRRPPDFNKFEHAYSCFYHSGWFSLEVVFQEVIINQDKQLVGGAVELRSDSNVKELLAEIDKHTQKKKGKTEERRPEEGTATAPVVVAGSIEEVSVDQEATQVSVQIAGQAEPVLVSYAEGPVTIQDEAGKRYMVNEQGEVTGPDGALASTTELTEETTTVDSLLSIKEQLIQEVLTHFQQEINLWLDNQEKGPLDELLLNRLLTLPDCLPQEEEPLQATLDKAIYYQDSTQALLTLVEQDSADAQSLETLIKKLLGQQPPYRSGLSEAEWQTLLLLVCPYLLPEQSESPVAIEGISRNATLVVLHSLSSPVTVGKDRMQCSYTIADTLALDYRKLEIYHISENRQDTTMVMFYTDLPTGSRVAFQESEHDEQAGWSGKDASGNLVAAGTYLVKLTAATDKSYQNGYSDYDEVVVEDSTAAEFVLTVAQLQAIFPTTQQSRLQEVVDVLNEQSNAFDLTTKERMAHFLGQIGTETNGLKALKESSNYSAKNIFTIFVKVQRSKQGSSDKTHKYCDLIEEYDCSDLSSCIGSNQGPHRCTTEPNFYFPMKEGKPDYKKWSEEGNSVKSSYVKSTSLFDYVYSCRMDNGNKNTQDGSKYLGKGFIHMTGKDKYKRVSEAWNKKYPDNKKEFHGKDIDLLETDVEVAMKASLVLWEEDDMNDLADKGIENSDIDKVGAKVNGSGSGKPNGYKKRRSYTKKAHEVFNEN